MSVAYDLYLYEDADDDALSYGSDRLIRGVDELSEAKAIAQALIRDGNYARAIIGQGENVHEVYDTATDEAFQQELAEGQFPVPDVPAPGKLSRPSGLAERLLTPA